MLEIKNLSVGNILRGVSLSVKPGETHVIMGRNGSGKSTLLNSIMKNPAYEITGGRVLIDGEDISGLATHEIARKGVFLGLQNPPAIPGVSAANLIKHATKMTAGEYLKKSAEACDFLGVPREWLAREVNAGFSGGEKKRMAMLEMLMLNPRLALLDEPDSGVDVEAIDAIGRAIGRLKSAGAAFVIVSHYARLIEGLAPDFVHMMQDGKIIRSGGMDIAREVEENGFGA
jgi:Fe-S cluster assembly ATP-binding protein